MLNVPSGFIDAFAERIITSSRIVIKDNNDVILYDENDLSSVNIIQRNSYFFNGVPNIDCTIKTLKVQIMPAKDTPLRIYFEVNGYMSTDYLLVYVKETKLDKNKFYGTIKAKGYFESNSVFFETNGNRTNMYELNYLTATPRKVLDLLYYPTDTSLIFDLPRNPTIKYLYGFTEMTNIEIIQALAICVGGALDYDPTNDKMSCKLFSSASYVGALPLLNVFDYDVANDEKGTSVKISDVSIDDLNEVEIMKSDVSGGQSSIRVNLEDNNYYVSNVVFPNSEIGTNKKQSPLYFNYFPNIYAERSGNSAGEVVIYGKKMYYKDPTTNQEGHIIRSPFIDSNNASYVLSEATNYFSHDEIYTFDCRVNPAFQPLDLVIIDDKIICLEQVEIEFNGGFRGKLIGRNIGAFSLQNPVISNLTYDENSFTFLVVNNNNVDVVAKIVFSNGTLSRTISANSNSQFTQLNAHDLLNSFQASYYNALEDYVYVYFEYQIGGLTYQSDNVVVLQPDVVKQPTISNLTYTQINYFSFDIQNSNSFDVDLKIKYSSGATLTFSVSAGAIIHIDQDNATELKTSFNQKLNGLLSDDVYCYFEDNGIQSNNVMIIEEDN